MDEAPKTWFQIVIGFSAFFMLLTCLTFFMKASAARQVLYAVTEYFEVNDSEHVDESEITSYCDSKGVACSWEKVTSAGIGGVEDGEDEGNRIKVSVSFTHYISWLELRPNITISATTRLVDY